MNKVPDSVRMELAALVGKPDDDIDFTDIPATVPEDWEGAIRARFYKPVKKQLTVRIDADIIEWLKNDGAAGYQKRLNAILRNAMMSTGSRAKSR